MAEIKPQSILCIEDEQEMIDLIRLILSRRGFNVVGATSGSEGLAEGPMPQPSSRLHPRSLAARLMPRKTGAR